MMKLAKTECHVQINTFAWVKFFMVSHSIHKPARRILFALFSEFCSSTIS